MRIRDYNKTALAYYNNTVFEYKQHWLNSAQISYDTDILLRLVHTRDLKTSVSSYFTIKLGMSL
jgi:hypothetical protein